MKPLFIHYPNCGTCKKAAKWLSEHNPDVEYRHIVENPPTRKELALWIGQSGLPLKRFFNTSGRKYRELGVKDRMQSASTDELIDLLATDGMLVKRPILVQGETVLVGFRESEWADLFNSE